MNQSFTILRSNNASEGILSCSITVTSKGKESFIHSLTIQALHGTRSISSQGSNAGRKGGDCPIEPDHSLSCRGSGDESLSNGLA
jgi:hypothetical protein